MRWQGRQSLGHVGYSETRRAVRKVAIAVRTATTNVTWRPTLFWQICVPRIWGMHASRISNLGPLGACPSDGVCWLLLVVFFRLLLGWGEVRVC
jgi:hypothetical protein